MSVSAALHQCSLSSKADACLLPIIILLQKKAYYNININILDPFLVKHLGPLNVPGIHVKCVLSEEGTLP